MCSLFQQFCNFFFSFICEHSVCSIMPTQSAWQVYKIFCNLYVEHITSRKEKKTDASLILKSSVGLFLGIMWRWLLIFCLPNWSTILCKSDENSCFRKTIKLSVEVNFWLKVNSFQCLLFPTTILGNNFTNLNFREASWIFCLDYYTLLCINTWKGMLSLFFTSSL